MTFRHKIMGLAVAGALALFPSLAQAQYTTEPIYTTLKLMYSYQNIDDFKWSARADGFDKKSGTYKGQDESDNAFGGGIAIGYDFGSLGYAPVRVELEYLHRSKISTAYKPRFTSRVGLDPGYVGPPLEFTEADVVLADGSTNIHASSHKLDYTVQTVFANAYWDFRNSSTVTPYVGAGLGAAYVDATLKSPIRMVMGNPNAYYDTGNGLANVYGPYSTVTSSSRSTWNFAWNVGAGLAWQITPSVLLDLNYRYSDFGKAEFNTTKYEATGLIANPDFDGNNPETSDNPRNLVGTVGTFMGKSEVKLNAHEVILGLRFTGY